jgi:hypothetical protein
MSNPPWRSSRHSGDHYEARAMRREDTRVSRFQARGGDRLYWRVIVQSPGTHEGSRGARPMAWHLVHCADPASEDAHCLEGRVLLAARGDPDGHCLVHDVCPRCAMSSAPKPVVEVPVTAPDIEPPAATNGDVN